MGDTLDLPSSISEWQLANESEGLVGVGIEDGPLVGAGYLSYRRFLTLRVIWKNISAVSFDPKMFDLDQWMGHATDILKDYQSWHDYNESFNGNPDEGNFALARVFQAQASQVQSNKIGDKVVFRNNATSSSGTSSLSDDIPRQELEEWPQNEYEDPSSDIDPNINEDWNMEYLESDWEPTIKTALVLFLTAITMSVPDLGVEWVMCRKTLTTKFYGDIVKYKVHVDAFLKGKDDDVARVLVDVREPRRSEPTRIEMTSEIRIQESAQMVAWMMTSPDRPQRQVYPTSLYAQLVSMIRSLHLSLYLLIPANRRIIISQDKDEIFLIFAEYGKAYTRYLDSIGEANIHSIDPKSFLTMYEVGPFNTNHQPAMSKLGAIILALVLRDARYIYKRPNMDGGTCPRGKIVFGDLTPAEMYGPFQADNIWF